MFKLNDGNDIDDRETRDGIVARAYRKAGPFVPDVWNPVPRFERINAGICPDCDERLNDNGYCAHCHIVPALDPDFQRWLAAQPITPTDETITLTAPPSTPFGDLVYWHQRASKLAPGRDIIVTTARK
jgi:hypothetical protein